MRNLEGTQHRRNVVLAQMMKYEKLTREEFDSLKVIPLDVSGFNRPDHRSGLATYFREQLRGWLKTWVKEYNEANDADINIYRSGLKVYTTIDTRIQQHAEDAVNSWLPQLQETFNDHWANRKDEPWTYQYMDVEERINPDFIEDKIKVSPRYLGMKKRDVPQDSIELAFNTPREMKIFSWNHEGYEVDTLMSPRDSIYYYLSLIHI